MPSAPSIILVLIFYVLSNLPIRQPERDVAVLIYGFVVIVVLLLELLLGHFPIPLRS